MIIMEWMKKRVISISSSCNIREAAELFVKYHIGTLPVVDENFHPVGLLQIRDLFTLVMPDFSRLVEDFHFVHSFGAVEDRIPSREVLDCPVTQIMQPPVFVEEESGLIRAASMLHQRALADLPVVDGSGRLVGIISRVDVGIALISNWKISSDE